MDKIIFLDLDGVICLDRPDILEPPQILNLKRILDETGAKVVLSSAWRNRDTWLNSATEQLGYFGIQIYSVTPRLLNTLSGPKYRWQEIQKWLNEHQEIGHFAIIDDDIDAELPDDPGSFFHTDYNTDGLNHQLADQIIEYFRGVDCD